MHRSRYHARMLPDIAGGQFRSTESFCEGGVCCSSIRGRGNDPLRMTPTVADQPHGYATNTISSQCPSGCGLLVLCQNAPVTHGGLCATHGNPSSCSHQ